MKSIKIRLMPQDKIVLPYAHFHILQGLVYSLLSFDSEYAYALHEQKRDNRDAMKLFCFSDLQGQYENDSESKTLTFCKECIFEIRSSNDKTVDIIEQRLQSDPCILLNDCECRVTGVETASRNFFDTCMVFSATTPITVYQSDANHSVYYSFADAEFYDLVKNNLKTKYALVYGKEYEGEFTFECLQAGQKAKCVTTFKNTYITGYYGKYLLKATPEMLAIAYYCGVGSKNSMGFGFIQ